MVYHEEHRRAVKEIPLDRLLLETDSPVTYGRGSDFEYQARPADILKKREEVGLDKPFWQQYVRFLCTFDFPTKSWVVQQGRPVSEILGKAVIPSLSLTLPALAAVATLQFTWIFNDYLWAIVLLRSDSLKPITAGLATLQGQYVTDWPVIVAGALIGTLPTLLVFLFLQRYFIEGLTLGSTK